MIRLIKLETDAMTDALLNKHMYRFRYTNKRL